MDVGYIISSHKAYEIPLNKLVDSMFVSGVTPGNIFVAVGGYTEYKEVIEGNWYNVDHNSFDFTGLIEFLQQDAWTPEYVMTLQDTMEFTEQTHALVMDGVDVTKEAIAVFGGQCNLVLYSSDYLYTVRDFIFAHKDMSKLESIRQEGILWKMLPDNRRGHYNNGTMDVIATEAYPYDTNIPRIVERYNAIQLLKYKANYGQNMNNLITEP